MMSEHERKLKIVDGIDDKIIDRNTEKRAALMQVFALLKERRRIKRAILGSTAGLIAASIFLSILIPLFMLTSKQVPIYKGMSVSGVGGEFILAEDAISERVVDSPIFLAPTVDGLEGDSTPGEPEDSHPETQEAPSEPESIWNPNAIGETYFAAPGEDILITVHIDNPDAFEILSFTLNGEKYSSYMFEEGSDLEHLVLKVNVGELEGFKEYTIDAIKYVDTDDTIKSVIMDGERTIKVGVASEKNKPLANVQNVQCSYDSISFGVSIPDTLGLIKNSGREVRATLYLDKSAVSSKALGSMNETLSFVGLEINKEYRLVITATYDAMDGEGVKERVIAEQNIATACPFTFHHIASAPPGFYFDLYGGIQTKDTSIVIDSGSLMHDGVTTDIDDLAYFPVPSGDSILNIKFRIGSKYCTAEMQIGPYISDDELREYYSIVETHTVEVEDGEDEIPPEAIDLIPSSSDAIIVYAISDGIINDLPGNDVIVSFRQDDGTTLIMRYESIKSRRDLTEGQKIHKGEAIGCFITTRLSPNSACIDGKYVHFSVQAGDSYYFYDPRSFVP